MSNGKTSFFPFFADMAGKTLLFVGGGRIVSRRLKALMAVLGETSGEWNREKLQVIVVSPEITETVAEYEKMGYILWKKRKFLPQDVDSADLVIAAADCPKVNEEAVRLCRKKGIPVNDGGKKENCDFYFPGIAVKGDVVAGITASGKDHRLTRKITEEVRKLFDRLLP